MKEAYCSYEVSKLLKEKGFDEYCDNYYDQSSDEPQQLTLDEMYYSYDEFIKAPTHQMACAWLREKGYHIYTFNLGPLWIYEIQSLTKDWTFSFGGFENHDAAIEAAIKYCLENEIWSNKENKL